MAVTVVKRSLQVCNRFRKKTSVIGSLTPGMKTNYNSYTAGGGPFVAMFSVGISTWLVLGLMVGFLKKTGEWVGVLRVEVLTGQLFQLHAK